MTKHRIKSKRVSNYDLLQLSIRFDSRTIIYKYLKKFHHDGHRCLSDEYWESIKKYCEFRKYRWLLTNDYFKSLHIIRWNSGILVHFKELILSDFTGSFEIGGGGDVWLLYSIQFNSCAKWVHDSCQVMQRLPKKILQEQRKWCSEHIHYIITGDQAWIYWMNSIYNSNQLFVYFKMNKIFIHNKECSWWRKIASFSVYIQPFKGSF